MALIAKAENIGFFTLTKAQEPYNPSLLSDVKSLLQGTRVDIIESTQPRDIRTTSSDLLIGVRKEVRDSEAFVLGAFAPLLNDRMLDTLVQLHAATDNDLGFIGGTHLVMTYYEGRDDVQRGNKKNETEGPKLLKLYRRLLAASSIEKPIKTVTIWDPHSPSSITELENLYEDIEAHDIGEVPVLSLTAGPLFADHWNRKDALIDEDSVVLSPDLGDIIRSVRLGEELKKKVYVTPKYRDAPNASDPPNDLYEVTTTDSIVVVKKVDWSILKGKKVFTVDDSVDTGGTVIQLGQHLKNKIGVKEFHLAVTHGIFAKPWEVQNAIRKGHITSLVTTDTLPCYSKVPEADLVSIAKPTALLMKAIAEELTREEKEYLCRFIYDPGPIKEVLLSGLDEGKIPRYQDSTHKVAGYWDQLLGLTKQKEN